MNRPEVRIIDQQQEEVKPVDISQYEREMLLGKYGFRSQPSYTEPQPVDPNPNANPNAGLSFEEMCHREEQRLADERARKYQQMYGPKPITFGGNNYHSSETYGSDSDSGLNFKITVVSDMPIPKNY